MRSFSFESYGGPETARFVDVPEPDAAPGRVVIRLVAAGINPADIKVREGLRQGKVEVRFPMAMGREASGVVVDDPSGTFAPGELVFGACASGFGALAETVALDLAGTASIPDGVSPEQAAVIPVALGTAWDALGELAAGPGDTVLVLGAGGGVGVHALQLARHLGATAVGVASAAKRKAVTDAGGVHVESGPGWDARVRALAPITAVVDAVGGDTLRAAAALVDDPARIRSSASPAPAKELGGSGITRRRTRAVFAELAGLVASGALRPVIGARFAFSDAAAAVAAVETGHALGKVVVTA